MSRRHRSKKELARMKVMFRAPITPSKKRPHPSKQPVTSEGEGETQVSLQDTLTISHSHQKDQENIGNILYIDKGGEVTSEEKD